MGRGYSPQARIFHGCRLNRSLAVKNHKTLAVQGFGSLFTSPLL